jgi:Zn-dependent metalloprotease
MKIILAVLIPISLFTSCKKDISVCKNYKELSGQEQLIDLNTINALELIDTLAKYPELQLYKFENTGNGWVARCNVFYKGLIIFSDTYLLNKSTSTGTMYASDTLRIKVMPTSLEPTISSDEAIKTAKRNTNYDHTCISYRLGIHNVNYSYSSPKNYKLVWKIEGTDKYPYTIVDATTNRVIVSDNGIRTGWID